MLSRLHSIFQAPQPEVTDIEGVELLRTGRFRPILGPGDITVEHLQSIVEAANDSALREPPLKIGHFDSRFMQDGEPAYGWVRNPRVEELPEGGHRLVGDYAAVPTKLAGLIRPNNGKPAPYRSRSVEIEWDVEVGGKKYPAVLSAVALLGVTKPAIEDLDDVLDIYYTAAAAPEGQNHSTLLAEVNIDDVRRAFMEGLSEQEREQRYPSEIWLESQSKENQAAGFLIIQNMSAREIERVPFTIDRKGAVGFGDSETVRVQYVTAAAADGQQPAREILLHREFASGAVRGTIGSSNKGRRLMNRDEMLAVLKGWSVEVPEGADDAKLKELVKAGPVTQSPDNGNGNGDGNGDQGQQTQTPAPQPTPTTQPQQQPEGSAQPGTQPEVVQLSKGTYDEIEQFRKQYEEERKQRLTDERERLVASALGAGKIRPSEREKYLSLLEAAPEQAKSLLDSLQPVVPVSEIGVEPGGDPEAGGDKDLLKSLWPSEYAQQGGN